MYRINRPAVYTLFFAILVFEIMILPILSVKGVQPNLTAVFVIFIGLFYGVRTGLEVGLVCGFLRGAIETGPFGSNILLFGVLGFTAGVLSDKVYRSNLLTQVVLAFIAVLIVSGVHMKQALFTAFIAPLVFMFLQRLFNLKESF